MDGKVDFRGSSSLRIDRFVLVLGRRDGMISEVSDVVSGDVAGADLVDNGTFPTRLDE